MKVRFTLFSKNTNWIEGTAGPYKFRAKLYDKGTVYGIDNGRVSVLEIFNKEKKIIEYERSWYIRPGNSEQERVLKKVLEFLERAPKRFS